ncbi:MAG: flagellar filament capping protein FliD [Spirochaetota bacterium]
MFTEEEEEDEELASLPHKVELGPTEETVIRGIELEGYNISRERPIDPPEDEVTPDQIYGVGVVFVDDEGERVEKIYTLDPEAEGKHTIPIGGEFADQSISRIVFYCNKESVTFKDAAITTPLEGQQLLNPKNVIAGADNAKLRIDDIEVERETNDGINDVVKGVTLNLVSADEETPVELTIDHDIDKSVEKIKAFVKVYNEYLEYNKQLTKAKKTEKTGEYNKTKKENGLFMGDMSIIRIENSLKQTVSSPYPSTAAEPIKLLSDIGVSTGRLNANWDSIQDGMLVVDEEKLRETLVENPDGVRDLFGSDTDGDNRIDNGFAFTFEYKLKPYTQTGKNIIANKIDLQEESIDQIDKQMVRKEEHLKAYEEKLRQKFSNMERSLSGSKSQSQWMKNQMGGGGSGK